MTFYFSAPYMLPDGNTRASGYGFNGTPSVMFNGTVDAVGGTASGSMFATYQPLVNSGLASVSPLTIDAGYVIQSGQVTVTADIGVDLATSGSNRRVMFFVTQQDLHANLNMVVALLPEEAFSLTTPGQAVSVQRTFPMAAGWNQPDLNIIVLVQNTVTKEVYQAGQAIADYAGRVVLDADPDGVDAHWTITGPDMTQSGSGDLSLGLFTTGQYTVVWDPIPYWDSPVSPLVQTLNTGDILTFFGTYTNGPFGVVTANPLGDVTSAAAVSLVDIDNDGDLDVHLTGSDTGDLMLRNDGGNAFTNLDGSALVTVTDVRGAAWADIDGDGNLDVYLARSNQANALYMGDGAGGFTPGTALGTDLNGPASGAAWVDYNNDGLLDLAVINENTANVLLENQGEFIPGMVIFTMINGAFANTGNGSCVAWGDGDLDGRLDPFLVNRFNSNVLFQSTTFGFSDMTLGAGMNDLGNGMGAAWGDYDNDGDFDLYLANDGQADRFYECVGPFQFTQVSNNGLGDTGRGRGIIWADFNNDTHLDLYVARYDETDLFLLADGLGNFDRVPVGPAEATWGSNAVACGDMNGNGRIDVYVTRVGAANVLFENGLDTGNHWVQLRLTGAGTNTTAIGARVVLTAGGVSQTRLVTPGSGYLNCSAADPHFGLAAATVIDQIDIYWPDGMHQVVGTQPVDGVINITEGLDPASAVVASEVPLATSLTGAYPNPFNPSTTISFALKQDTRARLEVFTIDGRHVRTLTDDSYAAGPHSVVWTGTDNSGRQVASGTYLYRLTTGDGVDASGSIVLVK